MTNFIDGLVRGALAGSVALLAGLLIADLTAHAGAPLWLSAGLGLWVMLVMVAVLRPSE